LIIRNDEVEVWPELRDEFRFGLHANPGRLETCTAELPNLQLSVNWVILQHEDVQRSEHPILLVISDKMLAAVLIEPYCNLQVVVPLAFNFAATPSFTHSRGQRLYG
jgi:hypothetical protein